MKAIRYIIFIPIITLIIWLVYFLIPLSVIGLIDLMSLSKFWLILLIILFGGFAIAIFQFVPVLITLLTSKLSPNKEFAFYSVLTISILLGIGYILEFWLMNHLNGNGLSLLLGIILTCLTIGYAISFSIGAGIEVLKDKELNFEMLLSFGSIVFNIGIFLIFCLLTTKLCYINPDKTYTWYSGIWHGIFAIPNWINSWFYDDLFCKAPNSTIAYSVWWWISFIFIGLGFLGGGSRRN